MTPSAPEWEQVVDLTWLLTYEKLTCNLTSDFSIYHTFQYNAKYTYSTCEHPGIEPGNLSTINQHVDKERFHASPRAPARTCVTHNLIVYNKSLLILTRPVLRIELRSITTPDY